MADTFVTGYRYYYSQLPEHMKKVYKNIYNGLAARRRNFSFVADKHNGIYPTTEVITGIYGNVMNDNPALYYVNNTNLHIYYSFAAMGMVRITYEDFYTPAQHVQLEQDLARRAQPILDHIRTKKGEYNRLYDLYRYLLATIRYDHDFVNSNTRRNLESLTITGPLIHRRAVCNGYSQIFKLLCDQLGIGCFSIVGTAISPKGWEPHCWNIVALDGRFYHVDVTFDSCHFHDTGKYTHGYFLRGDDAMLKDHKWDRDRFPLMPGDHRR